MKTFEKSFTVGDKIYIVEFSEKRDEGFLFMTVNYASDKGGTKRNLSSSVPLDEQKPVALLAKKHFEDTNGEVVTQFHYDNMAGGLAAQVPPKEQIYRALRDERTGAILAPGNSKPGNTTMISRGAWTATIDRAYPELWTREGDGKQSWETDGTFNAAEALGQTDQSAEIARLKAQLDRLTQGMK